MEQDTYFFEIQTPDKAEDCVEVAASDLAAREYANRIIRLLKEVDGYDEHGLIMVVRDHAGHTLCSTAF